MKKYEFCFCTVASRGYAAHAAGLWKNIRELHPNIPLVVLALDEFTRSIFCGKEGAGLICISAEEAWGKRYWHNITMRSNVPESAYASKAAVVCWVFESEFSDSTILLDSDTLLLAALDDLIDGCKSYELLLVPTRHDLRTWRRTQKAGIFSAGVVGFSKNGASYAEAWKAMCFEQCMALPIDCTYNEQKYLEYLIGHADTLIVRDSGINVSATILDMVGPLKNQNGQWFASDGTEIRMFHISRTTEKSFDFSKLKMKLNADGLKMLGLSINDPVFSVEKSPTRRWFGRVAFGGFFESAQVMLIMAFRNIMFLQRIFQSNNGRLPRHIRKIFKQRKQLLKDLWY